MIYFVRHGQTDWNLEKRIQGFADIHLNETGIAQAKDTKEQLKSIKFDKVFCSPLSRAVETCNIITDEEITIDKRITERNFGEFEGLKKTEFDFSGFWNRKACQHFLEAEDIFHFEERVYDFLDEINEKFNGKNILIVCHGGVGLIISGYFNGKPSDGDYLKYLVNNGQILTFNNEK